MMTKFIFIFLAALSFLVSDISAQDKQTYSAALYIGGFFPGNDFIYYPKTGYNISLDMDTKKDNFAFFVNGTYNTGKQEEIVYVEEKPESQNVSVFEIYGGPRWYYGYHTKMNGMFDAGFGYYKVSIPGNESNSSFGFNIGAGVNFPLGKTIAISFKVKYHAFTRNTYTAYGGAYLGLRYFFQ